MAVRGAPAAAGRLHRRPAGSRCRHRPCRPDSIGRRRTQLARSSPATTRTVLPARPVRSERRHGSRSSSPCTDSSRSWTASRRASRESGRCELQNIVAVVPGRLATRDRDHGPPRQHRPGTRRERQRVRDGSADRARTRLRPRGGNDDLAGAALEHARLRLDRRRRLRSARCGAVRRQLAVPRRRAGRAQPRRRRRARRAPTGDRRRYGPFAGSGARPNRSGAHRRSRPAACRRERRPSSSCCSSASRSRSASRGRSSTRGVPGTDLTTLADATPQGFVDDPLSSRRLGELGRAAQTTIGSLDAGLELAQGTTSYIYLGGRIVQGWAIQLVLLTALLPFAIGAIDLFARCRRRRIKLAPAARSLRSRLVFWGYGALLLFVAAQLGAFPEGEARPLPPDAGVYQPSPVVLGVLGALLLVGWLVVRQPLIPRRPARLEETLAGHTVALLALGLAALVVVATNPYPSSTCSRRSMPGSGSRRSHDAGPFARAASPRSRAGRARRACCSPSRRGSTSAWRRRGTCSRSSRSATCPGSRCSSASSGLRSRVSWPRSPPGATRPIRTCDVDRGTPSGRCSRDAARGPAEPTRSKARVAGTARMRRQPAHPRRVGPERAHRRRRRARSCGTPGR